MTPSPSLVLGSAAVIKRRSFLPWLIALILCASKCSAFLLPRHSQAANAVVSTTTPSCPPSRNACKCASDAAAPSTTTALKHGSVTSSSESSGPMSKVDSSKGGCPFLDTSYVYKTYAVPALFSAEDSRPIVLFDGQCNLCNKFVQTLLKYDSCSDDERGNLRFAALQSRVGDLLVRRMSDDLRAEVLVENENGIQSSEGESNNNDDEVSVERYKSIVVCGPEKTYVKSSAVFQILQSLGGPSKRLKVVQYLGLMAYVLPTRVRDRIYQFVSKRRKRWFGTSDECLLFDESFEDRFVHDGVLTGTFRDPFADPHAKVVPSRTNLFEGESPPVRGDRVRIIWPMDSEKDPSVSYDDEFPDGVCIIGGTGTISTIDLPMRVVMRVDRDSVGLGLDEKGDNTMIAWAKPEEVAAL